MASIMKQTNHNIFSLNTKANKSSAFAVEHTCSQNKKLNTNLSSRDTEATLSLNSDLQSADEMAQECQSEDLEVGTVGTSRTPTDKSEFEQEFWCNIQKKIQKRWKSKQGRLLHMHSKGADGLRRMLKKNRKINERVKFKSILFDKTVGVLNTLIRKAKSLPESKPLINSNQALELHSEIFEGLLAYHTLKKQVAPTLTSTSILKSKTSSKYTQKKTKSNKNSKKFSASVVKSNKKAKKSKISKKRRTQSGVLPTGVSMNPGRYGNSMQTQPSSMDKFAGFHNQEDSYAHNSLQLNQNYSYPQSQDQQPKLLFLGTSRKVSQCLSDNIVTLKREDFDSEHIILEEKLANSDTCV